MLSFILNKAMVKVRHEYVTFDYVFYLFFIQNTENLQSNLLCIKNPPRLFSIPIEHSDNLCER